MPLRLRLLLPLVFAFALGAASSTASAQRAPEPWGSAWSLQEGTSFGTAHSVVDAQRRLLFAMTDSPAGGASPGTSRARHVVALNIADGTQRWLSRAAHVPLLIEQGHLVALREATPGGSSRALLLSIRTGAVVARCRGQLPALMRNFSARHGTSYVRGVRRNGRAYILAESQSWHVGGAVSPPGIVDDAEQRTTVAFALAVNGRRCTVNQVEAAQVGGSGPQAYQIMRSRERDEWVFTVMQRQRGAMTRHFEATRGVATLEPSMDGRFVRSFSPMRTPAGPRFRVTYWDVQTGARLFVHDAQAPMSGAGFYLFDDQVLNVTGGLVSAIDRATGAQRWLRQLVAPTPPPPMPP